MTFTKRYGVTVTLCLDGAGYDSDLTLTCDNAETANKCKYALGEEMPMPDGAPCTFFCNGRCRNASARFDALKKAKAKIAEAIKDLEEECR